MKPEIEYQKKLMESALLTLEQIELVTLDSLKKKLEIEYAETMAELAGELVKLARPITNNQTQY